MCQDNLTIKDDLYAQARFRDSVECQLFSLVPKESYLETICSCFLVGSKSTHFLLLLAVSVKFSDYKILLVTQ